MTARRKASLLASLTAPPARAFVPPPPPPDEDGRARGALTATGETFATTIEFPVSETLVYTCVKQWRALDVYLSQKADQIRGGVFTVRVYANLAGGLRVLVQTGRFGALTQVVGFDITPRAPIWACAARAQATSFSVTLEWVPGAAPGTKTGLITVGLVASNEANEPPEWVGAMRVSLQGVDNGIGTDGFMPDPELLYLTMAAQQTVVAPRFALVFDALAADVPGLSNPVFSFPITGPGGVPAASGLVHLNWRPASGAFSVLTSSDPATHVAVADCWVQAVIR